MAISFNNGRQYVLSAKVNFSFADLTEGADLAIKLPIGAQIIRGELGVSTGFNDTTAATIAVGDGSGAAALLTATNVKVTGITALTGAPKEYPAGGNIIVTYAGTDDDATTGEGWLRVSYVIDGRANEVNP